MAIVTFNEKQTDQLRIQNQGIQGVNLASTLKELKPITLMSQDATGRKIQLWRYRQGFIGAAVNPDGSVHVVLPQNIHNSLQPQEPSGLFLNRIASLPPKKWDLILTSNLHIIVWPHLVAAGRPSPDYQGSEFTKNPSKIGHIFRNEGGHFKQDTPANRDALVFVISKAEHWAGTVAATGRDYFFAILPDGRQGWVEAKAYDGGRRYSFCNAGVNEKGSFARFNQNEKDRETCFQGKVAYRVHHYALKVLLGRGDGPGPDGPRWSAPILPMKSHVSLSQFRQVLQQTGLVDSYNSAHLYNMMPHKGSLGGEIGGVACSTSYIKGLFDTQEGLFEEDHCFALPARPDGSMPFSNEQLKQVLRELAVGIYVHSTVPFFSLHFRQEGSDLFPVIHPAYEKTLVGRIIGMLDYWMKAYLNGAAYEADFIENWHLRGDWAKEEATSLSKVIDFCEYCKAHLEGSDQQYMSLASLESIIEEDPSVPEILRSFKGFKNSFRIIAKENSIQKEGNLFVLDGDFDVFYDIQASPEYELALNDYVRRQGHFPASYIKMKEMYAVMAQRIHDHMVKMPICKEYFSLLSVINFFSGYFSTLKKYRKVPSLKRMESMITQGCPPVFPHLPVMAIKADDLKFNFKQGFQEAFIHHKESTEKYFHGLFLHMLDAKKTPYAPEEKAHLIQLFKDSFNAHVLRKTAPPVRRFFELNLDKIPTENLAKQVIADIEKCIKQLICQQIPDLFKKNKSWLENFGQWMSVSFLQMGSQARISELLTKISTIGWEDKEHVISQFSLPLTYLPHEVEEDTLEKIHRVVGGCGLHLQPQKVTASALGAYLREHNMNLLLKAQPETLIPFSKNETHPYVFFRLFNEDVPLALGDDYQWMEDLFLASSLETFDRLENRLDLEEAITQNDQLKFSALLAATSEVAGLKNRYGRNLLHHAALGQNVFFVNQLIAKGLSISQQDDYGFTPLHYAAMGAAVAVCSLLTSPATVNKAAKNGATPLFIAIQHGQEEIVQFLLSQKASFSLLAGGYSTLHCALHEGHKNIVAMILASCLVRPFINLCALEGGTPLMLAADLDDKQIVDKLLALGADPTIARADGLTPIEIAAMKKSVAILESLLLKAEPSALALEAIATKGACVVAKKTLRQLYGYKNQSQDTSLHLALRHGNIPVALYLIEECENSAFLTAENIEKETAAQMAIGLKLWGIIEALDKKGVIIPPKLLLAMGYHPFLKQTFEKAKLSSLELLFSAGIAAQTGNIEALTYIFEPLGVDLTKIKGPKGWGLFHYLAKYDGIFLFRKYLARTHDLLQKLSEDNETTLAAIAAMFGSKRVFYALLTHMKARQISLHRAYGPKHLLYVALEYHCEDILFEVFDPSLLVNLILDDKGTLPAHIAAKVGSEGALKQLALHRANLMGQDKDSYAPIDYAIRIGSLPCVEFLLSNQVPVTSYSLYLAAKQDNTKLLECLIKANRKAEVLDESLMISISKGHLEAFNRLLACNASVRCLSSDGWTPTLLASQKGHEQILSKILQIEPRDERTVGGKSPLHWAALSKQGPCIVLLLEAGHKDTLSATGLTAAQMGGLETKVVFQHQQKVVVKCFLDAIKKDDKNEISQILSSYPINSVFSFTLASGNIKGTLLQLLVRLTQAQEARELYKNFLKNPQLDPNVVDEQGNTFVHILLKENLSPWGIKGLDFRKRNYEGMTPLHVAAQYASENLFKEVLAYLKQHRLLDLLELADFSGETPLFYAIKGAQETHVKQLLLLGANVACLNHQCLSPLAIACSQEHLSIVALLLKANADPNQLLTRERITALHLALAQKNIFLVCYLLAHGSCPHIPSIKGDYPVHLAVQEGLNPVIHLMSQLGVSLNTRDKFGLEPKHHAALHGKTSTLAMILAHQVADAVDEPIQIAAKDDQLQQLSGMTLLHLACLSNHPETVSWLLAIGANPEIKSDNEATALSFAAESKSATSLLPLLANYRLASEPKYLYHALFVAIQKDNLEAVKYLYGRGLQFNNELINGYTGLHLACKLGAIQCTAWLLLQGVDVTVESKTKEIAIELAAVNSSVEQFKLMIQDPRIQVNHINIKGQSLAHLAAQANKIGHMMLLIKHGADLNTIDCQGRTPLHYAAKARHLGMMELLLACGADTNIADINELLAIDLISEFDLEARRVIYKFIALKASAEKGQTLLHVAVRAQSQLGVQILTQILDIEAINAKDLQGHTALYFALTSRQKQLALLLIQAGADVSICDKQGHSLLWFVSIATPCIDMVKLLVSAGVTIEDKDKVRDDLKCRHSPDKSEILRLLTSI